MVDMDICIWSHLKEELAWAADKWLQVISTIMLFENNYGTKELKNKAIFKFKTIMCTLLCGP